MNTLDTVCRRLFRARHKRGIALPRSSPVARMLHCSQLVLFFTFSNAFLLFNEIIVSIGDVLINWFPDPMWVAKCIL